MGATLKLTFTQPDFARWYGILRTLPGAGGGALQDIGEYLLNATEDRFDQERDPKGEPWEPLSAARLAQKKDPRILTESRRLRDSIVSHLRGYNGSGASARQLEVGTNVSYAAIHQFGGETKIPERTAQLYFRIDKKTGRVGNRFVKKSQSNFVQEARVGSRTIHIPARPYLGVSSDDAREIVQILEEHVQAALGA